MSQPPLVLSIGDPAGIGPELIVRAWLASKAEGLAPFVVAGGSAVMRDAATQLGLDSPVEAVANIANVADAFSSALPVLDGLDGTYSPGAPSKESALLALASLQVATDLAHAGEASGLVTAPVAKANLAEVGFAHPGQTEFLADACGLEPDDAVMMLAGPSLRAIPLTVHVALAEVSSLLTTELIVAKARIAAAVLRRDFGIAAPRLAVTGLNPHAGESGKFGDEEARIIAPAIKLLQDEGIAATGPHPADALFAPHSRAGFDAALCMYHDQALIPVKALDFDQGVNVTLGLPVIRTSPDHGTAFDIAGKGVANPGAMIAAIRLAGEMAARRAHG
ncbi:4-hydroxythreonine-4-phosphate dehydrogenase PdxA [Parerythrobacter aestuarii]|uniref:4-hydroxythreonine-4-phosphate dehydrogenase PdxA n=1 Tax=Parerythrobacter aestuarii TaxID=3020909 RepID=UPI0024DEC020|nr:4-hydroxythreonine-4-phosphate dehydrogenase PdxA [Parerythrobacter aestuarii]